MINLKDYYKIDEVKIYQDMIQACVDNNMEQLTSLMFHEVLNGQKLISSPPIEDSIIYYACLHHRWDMLQLFCDSTKVPSGIYIDTELSHLLGDMIGTIHDIRILEIVEQVYKCSSHPSRKTMSHSFLTKGFASCIVADNLSFFSHLFKKEYCESFDYQYNIFQLLIRHQSLKIGHYLFNQPDYYIMMNFDNVTSLHKEYRENTSMWQIILWETDFLERSEFLSSSISPASVEHINKQLQQKKLSQSLNKQLPVQIEKTQLKL